MTKLELMLKYVSEHNDFYKKRIKEYGIKDPLDITQWPILTRKELQDNRYNMFSDGYKTKYYNQQLRRQSSSGSTGMPVNVYWDYKDWYASNMSLWRKRLQWYGIKPSDKYCIFTLNAFSIAPEEVRLYFINKPRNLLSFNVSLIQNKSGYEQMAKIINEFEPDWLYIQPFVLNQLIQAYKNLKLEPAKSIRYIESIGEILTSDLRRMGEKFFGVKVTNMYGSEEMNGMAIECPDHHMHVLDENVLIETKDNNNRICRCGSGESIITNLNNMCMPLIRYAQGDIIDVNDIINCRYHNKSSQIKLIRGRAFERLKLGENVELNSYILLEILAEVNNEFDGAITTYRYVFDADNKYMHCYIILLILFLEQIL